MRKGLPQTCIRHRPKTRAALVKKENTATGDVPVATAIKRLDLLRD
jgi:hypothetical protein